MNKWIAGVFAAALTGSSAFAGMSAPAPTAKDLVVEVDEVNFVETAQKGIVLSGYVDAGYSYNFISRSSGAAFTSRVPGNDATAGGKFQLNALKLALEKALTDENKLQAGFRADLLVGEDAAFVGGQNGASSDSLFLEQAYVSLRVPVGNGIDVKVGKFVTTLGYEVIERPANLNITYSYMFQNMIPLWHVGVLAEYAFNDIVDAKFGVVNGANSDGLATVSSVPALLFGLGFTNPGGNATLGNNVYFAPRSGNDAANFGIGGTGPIVIYDVVGNWMPKFANDKLLLGFNADIGNFNGGGALAPSTWWGAAVYAKYQFTDLFSLASRGEYVNNYNDQKFFNGGGVTPPGAVGPSTDLWSWTLTAGFDLAENLLFRTEYRLDLGNKPVGGAFGTSDVGHTVAAQVVYSF
ncbi:MAG: hypothetical protein OHK005_19030 [Candidatus Methylacidiphilales bacterium]